MKVESKNNTYIVRLTARARAERFLCCDAFQPKLGWNGEPICSYLITVVICRKKSKK